jgi:hypothetical protein
LSAEAWGGQNTLILAVVSDETVVDGALVRETVTPNRALPGPDTMLPSSERNRLVLPPCPEGGRLMPYFGEVPEEEGVYRRSDATEESIVAQAVCSVESLAMRMPAGSRPCIVATQTPVIPTARQTSTREKAPLEVFVDFIVFMFIGGLGFVAGVKS